MTNIKLIMKPVFSLTIVGRQDEAEVRETLRSTDKVSVTPLSIKSDAYGGEKSIDRKKLQVITLLDLVNGILLHYLRLVFSHFFKDIGKLTPPELAGNVSSLSGNARVFQQTL